MEVGVGDNHFTCFKPNLDRSLHDGHLCAAADRSSYLPNGVRHWWLCGGLFSAQASNAYRVSVFYFLFSCLEHQISDNYFYNKIVFITFFVLSDLSFVGHITKVVGHL